MAITANVEKIEIETDSQIVIRLLKGEMEPAPNLRNLISSSRSLLQGLRNLRLLHNYREANSVADRLANHGRTIPDFAYFSQPPDFVIVTLNLDASHHLHFGSM